MSVLDKVNSSNDIKQLNREELPALCNELREMIIHTVANNGGHLSSNLGAVELTVALHRVYDSSNDRILFDVGHQCYSHKIITGRKEAFDSIRTYHGLSGFPKPYESDDDPFVAGHASDSISVALGMAKARTLLHADYSVVSVIGDGALTGGPAYEGLVNAAASKEPLVVVLNDNNMSIGQNVGGTANFLQRIRVKSTYVSFKKWFRNTFGHFKKFYSWAHSLKEKVKDRLLPDNIFADMGFEYLGPIDGHNLDQLESVLTLAKDMTGPVLVHVLTQKGRGYKFAENDPEKYHGVGPFSVSTGELITQKLCFSDVFGKTLCELAEKDSRIVGLTAAMAAGTGLEEYSKRFPTRFFDVGIAESHAVAEAAAMAKQGLIPVFSVYSSFLQRAYDMLIEDVSLQNAHVVLAVDRAGIVGNDGETHHGLFDISFLSSVPNMTVLCPASFAELRVMLEKAIFEIKGPVAIRYPRGSQGDYIECSDGPAEILNTGSDITMVGYGTEINELIKAADCLKEKGISAEVIKLNQLKPYKYDLVLQSLRKTGKLFIPEEACSSGCIGYKILTCAAREGVLLSKAVLINCGEGIVPHGSVSQLKKDYGLDSDSIVKKVAEIHGQNST